MPMRVELKRFERIVIGESVIINSGNRTCFLIDGDTPVLREKDTVTADTTNTPARRLYLYVQSDVSEERRVAVSRSLSRFPQRAARGRA